MNRIIRGWVTGGVLVAVIAFSGNQLVWASLDWCCLPPSWAPPVTPAGASCIWRNSSCTSDGCSGDAWAVAGKGNCIAMESRECTGGAQTLVTLKNGHFSCDG